MRERIRGDMGGNLSHQLYGGYATPGYPFHGKLARTTGTHTALMNAPPLAGEPAGLGSLGFGEGKFAPELSRLQVPLPGILG
jgi:hypothetical protein